MVMCLEAMTAGATKSRTTLFGSILFVIARHSGKTRRLGVTVVVIVIQERCENARFHETSFDGFDTCRERTTNVYANNTRTSASNLLEVLKRGSSTQVAPISEVKPLSFITLTISVVSGHLASLETHHLEACTFLVLSQRLQQASPAGKRLVGWASSLLVRSINISYPSP